MVQNRVEEQKRVEKPGLRQPIAGYMGHVPGMVALGLHGANWRDLCKQDPKLNPGPRTLKSDDISRPQTAVATGLLHEMSDHINTRNGFMPRMDKVWVPPVVGYMGHVPGYGSGNLHGSPWHYLLSPTHRDSATSPFPMVRQPLSTPRSRPASASVDGRGSRVKIPNNIAGYLKKKGGSAGSRPTSAR